MASPYNIQLSPDSTPGHAHIDGLNQDSADKVSELLMLNHAKYHTYFNEIGLHNHIVHHLLSLWALGASPSEFQTAYDLNKVYQLPHHRHSAQSTLRLKEPAFFNEHLGDPQFYTSYLRFFQDEIAEQGVETIVKQYLFKADSRADDLLARMHSGFVHPILHLGFGLEFLQPCLTAEALASAAIHGQTDNPLPIFQAAEQHLASHPSTPQTSLLSVLRALRSDPVISSAVKPTDPPNRITDGLLKRVSVQQLAPYLAQWRIQPTKEAIAFHVVEMMQTCVYVSGAAQHPQKAISIDFFLMHSTNLSVFYPTFMGLEYLSLENKARLLTWKGWMDMVMYAAAGCPPLYPERIAEYVPLKPGTWEDVVARAVRYPDDGHTCKFVRAVLGAERASAGFEGRGDLPLGREDFLRIAHMGMDSVEFMLEPGYRLPEKIKRLYVDRLGMDVEVAKIAARFVRWCGVEGAWDDYPDLNARNDKANL